MYHSVTKIKIIVFFIILQSAALLFVLNSISHGGQAESYIARAKKYQGEGEYTKAVNECYKCIKKNPSYPYAYYHLGEISDVVLNDYETSILCYEKALSLLKFRKIFLSEKFIPADKDVGGIKETGETSMNSVDKVDAAISDINTKKDQLLEKIFHSIENPVYPTYTVIKKNKDIYSKPEMFSKAILEGSPEGQNELEFLGLYNNWYLVKLPTMDKGWVKWKDINLIYQKKTNPARLSKEEKARKYESFTRKYRNSTQAENASKKMDQLYFELANERKTISDYEMYLVKCPNGTYAKEAKNKIAELKFGGIRNDINKLKAFAHEYSDNQLATEAQIRIEELTFAQAKYSNNIKELYVYLKEYPEGRFTDKVEDIVLELELKDIDKKRFEKAGKTNTVEAYKEFIEKYPKSRFITEARDRIEGVAFRNAEGEGTIEAFKLFLKEYPDSSFTNATKRKIDVIQYEPYKSKDTAEAYKEFIDKFPENQFAGNAKEIIEKLQSKQVEKTIEKNKGEVTISGPQKEKHTNAKEQETANKLKKLESFYKKGLIDEDEYREKKAEMLNVPADAKEQKIANKLKKLESFYKKGLIDEDEYKKKKAEMLK